MKVLVLVPDLNMVGGVSTFFKSLETQFVKTDVVYFTRGTRAGIPPVWQIFIKLFDYVKFILELSIHSYDLVHVNSSLGGNGLLRDPWFVLISKLFGKRVLLFFHGWRADCVTKTTRPLLQLYLKSDAIAVLASDFKNDLLSWGYGGQVHVINTAVSKELEQYLEGFAPRDIGDEVTILFLSRIEIAKGIYEAIKAYHQLQKRLNKQLKLIIAGSGSELNAIKAFIDSNQIENVNLCGFVSGAQKAKVLLQADIYLFPSYEEGMPISVLEAMMAGLPVITRYTGGLIDFFDGSNMGAITHSKDPKVFADLLYDLISDPSTIRKISLFNNSYAKENFTLERFIEKLERIYTEV